MPHLEAFASSVVIKLWSYYDYWFLKKLTNANKGKFFSKVLKDYKLHHRFYL